MIVDRLRQSSFFQLTAKNPMSRSTTHTRPATGNPLLVGEHPALDFLNSVLAPDGEMFDHLYDGNAMRVWLGTSCVLPLSLRQAAALFSAAQMDQLAGDARTLREDFRRVLVRRNKMGAAGLTAKELECINVWLSRAPLTQTLVKRGGEWRLSLHRDPAITITVMAELASICADLLANQPPEQVRKCENPACTLWFRGSKRGPHRRWCSMAICGNRMKVAAHRARARDKQ